MLAVLKVRLRRVCRGRGEVFLAGREVTVLDRMVPGSYFLRLSEGDYVRIDKEWVDVLSVSRATSGKRVV